MIDVTLAGAPGIRLSGPSLSQASSTGSPIRHPLSFGDFYD